MTHDPHTTDVNAHGGPRPEPRPGWLDRYPVTGTAVGILAAFVLVFLAGIVVAEWVTQ